MMIRCKKEKASNPESTYKVLKHVMSKLGKVERQKEHFFTIGINNDCSIKFVDLTYIGTMSKCISVPYEPLRICLVKGAQRLIVAHNHINNPNPSSFDDDTTEIFYKACKYIGIEFLDHIIFTEKEYYSYNMSGKIDQLRTKYSDLK